MLSGFQILSTVGFNLGVVYPPMVTNKRPLTVNCTKYTEKFADKQNAHTLARTHIHTRARAHTRTHFHTHFHTHTSTHSIRLLTANSNPSGHKATGCTEYRKLGVPSQLEPGMRLPQFRLHRQNAVHNTHADLPLCVDHPRALAGHEQPVSLAKFQTLSNTMLVMRSGTSATVVSTSQKQFNRHFLSNLRSRGPSAKR